MTHHPPTPDDDAALDRLVDGELNDSQRRELLNRLDSTPDGWRRCALAFLEAQAWRRELRAFAGSAETRADAANRRWLPAGLFRAASAGLALAASFLLALWLGMSWGEIAGRDVAPATDGAVAQQTPTEPAAPVGPALVLEPARAQGLPPAPPRSSSVPVALVHQTGASPSTAGIDLMGTPLSPAATAPQVRIPDNVEQLLRQMNQPILIDRVGADQLLLSPGATPVGAGSFFPSQPSSPLSPLPGPHEQLRQQLELLHQRMRQGP